MTITDRFLCYPFQVRLIKGRKGSFSLMTIYEYVKVRFQGLRRTPYLIISTSAPRGENRMVCKRDRDGETEMAYCACGAGAAKGPTTTYQPLLTGRRYFQSRGLSSKQGSCFPVDNSGDKLTSRFHQSCSVPANSFVLFLFVV
jgi:hypothetical protein